MFLSPSGTFFRLCANEKDFYLQDQKLKVDRSSRYRLSVERSLAHLGLAAR